MAYPKALCVYDRPRLRDARLVLGFSGWMDGGDASTGTVDTLIEKLNAQPFAHIDPEDFYIYSFPGSMDVSALFRPEIAIEDGLVTEHEEPETTFYVAEPANVVLFKGREPNFRWRQYADCILALADAVQIKQILFVGSVSGIVPHTREPRFHCAVSHARHRGFIDAHNLLPSNYDGPGSFVSYLLTQCGARGIPMATLVAEVPAYVQGRNIKCIEAILRKLSEILDVPLDLEDLVYLRREFEQTVDRVVQARPDLADLIRSSEQDYDRDALGRQEDDLKAWFDRQNIQPE